MKRTKREQLGQILAETYLQIVAFDGTRFWNDSQKERFSFRCKLIAYHVELLTSRLRAESHNMTWRLSRVKENLDVAQYLDDLLQDLRRQVEFINGQRGLPCFFTSQSYTFPAYPTVLQERQDLLFVERVRCLLSWYMGYTQSRHFRHDPKTYALDANGLLDSLRNLYDEHAEEVLSDTCFDILESLKN